jgi:2-aminomuconate deaminase
VDEAGTELGHDIEAEARQCFANIRTILEDAGTGWDRIVDVTVFLTDMAGDFTAFNRVYAEHFPANQPARTTVEVGALPTPIHVELKVIATID